MINVQDVHKSFGRLEAVRGVSFSIDRGEVVGLLGPNGAGKSTTIRMLTGYLPPDAGSIRVAGCESIDDSRGARRAIGYLPENAPLYPEMSVRGYLDYRGRLYGLRRAERGRRVDAVIERVALREVKWRRIGQLSKGYRQRTGLAAALLHEPEVIVLDEPSNGLDPGQIREMRGLIRELGSTRTVLVSSHVLSEVEQVCTRVIVMARGRLRADGAPGDLIGAGVAETRYVIEVAGPKGADCTPYFELGPGVRVRVKDGAEVITAEGSGDGGQRWTRVEVTAPATAGDLRERLGQAAAKAGLAVRELRRDVPGLERVFFDLLERAEDECGDKMEAASDRGTRDEAGGGSDA